MAHRGAGRSAGSNAPALDAPDGPLVAFVPRLAVELGANGSPSWTSIDGSMLSADISGFTALSERLAGKGKSGAEEITHLVNTCFTALIDAAYLYDGEVVKFGGDALLIVFRGDDHERRAADAGLTMQRALHETAAAKRAHLSMTVGVADGPFDAFLIGSLYRELVITGDRATEVVRLEAAAGRGETLVSPSIAALLPREMQIRAESGGVVIAGSSGSARRAPAPRPPMSAELDRYVPGRVVDQLVAFESLGGEHRLVSIGFVLVSGIAAQIHLGHTDAVARALGAVVDDVVRAADAFGVTVLHTDIAPDGFKLVLCAGAPVNLGDTSDAMLQTALRIAAIDSPFVIRQGVQTGRVFAGFLGSEHRRTYTLMGDPVNTAARMIGPAGDREIVAVDTVVRGTRAVFETEALEPFLAKGKAEPVLAHRVLAVTDQVQRDTAGVRLIGRRRELDVLAHAIGELGEVVELVGPAGVGKSRLLDAAWQLAEGLRIYQGSCTPYGAASPYSVFRPLLRGGTGISVDAPPQVAGARLTELVTDVAPHLLAMLPLLAVPFGATVAATPDVDAIDPAFKRVRIHEVVVEYLDAVLTGPILLVLEDAHWVDGASGELINHLVRASGSRPWAAIVTRRDEGDWRITDAPHVVTLTLRPLGDGDIRDLAVEVSTRALADRDLDLIVTRAQGNPLFAIELTRALSEGAGELPDTIERIIASRFDQLDPSARRLVRIASVLGNQFDEAVVASMLDAEAVGTDVAAALSAAERAGAIARRAGSTWAFNHALARDTAYEGLPYSRRRQLHRLAAGTIEQRSTDRAAVAHLLSQHYAAARAHEQAWEYSLLAGRAAEAQHAYAEAAAAYERALISSRWCHGVTTGDRVDVAERLGDLLYDVGRFDGAERAYRLARRKSDDAVRTVNLVRKLGSVRERTGRPDRAIAWYRKAAGAIPATGVDARWLRARAEVALAEAGIRSRRGDQEGCLALARRAHADAVRAGDRTASALALERVHLATVFLRRPDTDGVGAAALEAHRANDDRSGMARVLINLGIEAFFASRWSDATDRYLEALDIAQQGGSVVLAATAAINSAEVLSDQGEWGRAINLLDGAVRNYTAVGYTSGIAAAGLFSGVAAMRAGQLDGARSRLVEAHGLLVRLGMTEMVDELDSHMLELDLLDGRPVLDDCRALLARFGADHPCTARVLRVRGLMEHVAGDTASAEATLRETLRVGPDVGLERALTLRSLLLVAPAAVDAAAWQAEVDAIRRDLGVHALPPVLPAR